MFVVIVHAHVKPDMIQDFITATLDNAHNSILEPGVARFDFYQQKDDPTRFSLIEIYRTEDSPVKHRATEHYNRWRNSVESMMAESRSRVEYNILYPPNL